MLRRRLVLSSSSDEEDDQSNRNQPQSHSQPQVHILSDTPDSLPRRNPNSNPTSNQPLEISDDEDFIDVSDHLSPPEPPPPPTFNDRPAAAPPPPRPPSPGGCPISVFLQRLGLRLRRDWLGSCVDGLERSVPGFYGLEVGMRAKLCFEKFLLSDMNLSGGGVLPENVDRLHLVDLPGPYVLQVDEIVNISCPLKGRYQKAPHGVKRCLKLSLTDGVQRVFGMEYRPIKDLDALAPAGLKVVICNVHIRHGLLMLVPEAFEILGGLVEELEAARQRLVEEVNKPPRGIRTRNREAPPLRTRATLAAWPPNGAHVAGATSDTTPAYTTTPFQVRARGAANVVPRTNADQRIEEEFPGIVSEESVIRSPSSNAVHSNVVDLPVPGGEENVFPNPSPDVVMASEEAPDITMGDEDDEAHMYTVPNSTTNTVPNTSSDVDPIMEEIDMDTTAGSMTNHASGPSLNEGLEDEEFLVADDDIVHPLILSGVREVPFTYLASLSAKWTSMKESTQSVKGIIKCILTGVKAFQFKYRTTYDLQAYVDDGSLISEIIIHHDVVQKKIGYSPQDVTAAITSPDTKTVNNMRSIMQQYQSFLVNFEGKMLVEINGTSPLPVALEMSQGCSESDAMLLLRRLKSSLRAQTQPLISTDSIYLSP